MAIAKIFGLEFTAQVVASGAWHEEVVLRSRAISIVGIRPPRDRTGELRDYGLGNYA